MSSPDGPLSLAQARHVLDTLRPQITELIALRADLTELRTDLAAEASSPLGGRAEAKALEARLYAVIEDIAAPKTLAGSHSDKLHVTGAQVKGYAPLLLDWPGELAGRAVLWCWLEGDEQIEWYHRVECGFAGRRPVPSLADRQDA